MTTQEWFAQAERGLPQLKQLLVEYHPVNRQPGRRPQDWITAPNAEAACTQVRSDIRKNHEGDPVSQLEDAIHDRHLSRCIALLNEAWFGVPESRSCWEIEGFREAVALLEDLPDDEETESEAEAV